MASEVSILIKLKDLFSSAFQAIADKMKSVEEKSKELQTQMDAEAEAVNKRVKAVEKAYQAQMDAEEEAVKAVGKAAEEYEEILEKKITLLAGSVEAHGTSLKIQMDAEDEGMAKVKEVEEAYQELLLQAARSQSQVAALAAQIAALKSKTITITVIRKTVYVSQGKPSGVQVSGGGEAGAGAGGGSNPYSGITGGTSAITKDVTEKDILPALKTLEREGKVAPGTVLQ